MTRVYARSLQRPAVAVGADSDMFKASATQVAMLALILGAGLLVASRFA